MKRLEELFGSDPAMAAELLTAANSVEYGFRSRISTICHALTILGTDRTRSLAVTIAMAGYIRTRLPREAIRPLWAHGIATAIIAEDLAARAGNSRGLLYTAGLTHDVGRLGLYSSSHDIYEPLLDLDFHSIDEANLLERELMGVTHSEAGEFLTRTWGFPSILSECARHHHAPAERAPDEIQIVHQACLMADSMGFPELRNRTEADSEDIATKWKGHPLFQRVYRRMKQFA
jgi:HD-like signal output (HDOD) protein